MGEVIHQGALLCTEKLANGTLAAMVLATK